MTDPLQTPVLYLAWQDAASRRWFTVGRLQRLPDRGYEFAYIRGYDTARKEVGMSPIVGFPEATKRYISETLFPHFQSRIMPKSREDYPVYIERLGFTEEPRDPLEILARSGGRKVTELFSFQLFPEPSAIISAEGERRYALCFFMHGLRYVQSQARERALLAKAGERLFLMADFQNHKDPDAIMIRTDDNHLLGWVPRYYCADIHELCRRGQSITVTIEHVNPPSTPSWLSVMCRLEAPWPESFRALSTPDYELLADGVR